MSAAGPPQGARPPGERRREAPLRGEHTRAEIEQLLYHEAHLLDSGRFAEWLDLMAPDLRYWAPVRAEVPRERERESEAQRLALFDETRASLDLRIRRIGTGIAWSETPPTRTRRLVSNVVVESEDGSLVRVRSSFMLFRSRSFSEEWIVVGCREDTWSKSDRWLLKERKITLDHGTVENLSLLL